MTGVYKIQSNIKSYRCYVGSAMNINKRFLAHRGYLQRNEHHSRKLQNHVNKYGIDDLVFSVLEQFDFISNEHLLSREQFYLDTLKPWFNNSPTAGNCGGVKHSAKTKKKMSIAQTGKICSEETKEKIRLLRTGTKATPETRKKLSDVLKGKKKPPFSEQHIKHLVESHKGEKHTPEQCDKISKGNTGKKRTPEMIETYRQANLGDKNPMWGKKQSLESIARRVESTRKTKELKKQQKNGQG
jgi:group I intron endonuclease